MKYNILKKILPHKLCCNCTNSVSQIFKSNIKALALFTYGFSFFIFGIFISFNCYEILINISFENIYFISLLNQTLLCILGFLIGFLLQVPAYCMIFYIMKEYL